MPVWDVQKYLEKVVTYETGLDHVHSPIVRPLPFPRRILQAWVLGEETWRKRYYSVGGRRKRGTQYTGSIDDIVDDDLK